MLGEVIGGRYRIVELIGQGGHGAVYRAQQVGLDREVALKVLHPQRMDHVITERFKREAELAQRLSHPNTIRLLDFGVHQAEVPYIVFELLKGRTLKELMKREAPLSDARTSRIATQVLKALMEAHSANIVHRDIKPTNIFVGEHAGEPDFVKVMDFGIAKSLRTNTKVLTKGGEVMGTPSYMAPEHIESRAIAPSTDLYSLGLMMAEMLSGVRVFDGTPIDVCVRQASPDPVPLSSHVLNSSLRDVIVRATRKKMDERYQSAAEMLRDVEVATGLGTTGQRSLGASWGGHVSGAMPSYPSLQHATHPGMQTFAPGSGPVAYVPGSAVPYSAPQAFQTNPPPYSHPSSPSGPMSGPLSFATATPQPQSRSLALPLALIALALGLAVAIALVFFMRGRAPEAQNPAPMPVPLQPMPAGQPVVIEPDMPDAQPEIVPSASSGAGVVPPKPTPSN